MMDKKKKVDPSIKPGARRIRKIVWFHEAVQARGPLRQNIALYKTRFSKGFFDQALDYALEQKMLYITSTFTPPYEPLISIHPPDDGLPIGQMKLEEMEQI